MDVIRGVRLAEGMKTKGESAVYRKRIAVVSWLAGVVTLGSACANVSSEPLGNPGVGTGGVPGSAATSNTGTSNSAGGSSSGGASASSAAGGGSGGANNTGGSVSNTATGGVPATGGASHAPIPASIPLPYADDFEDGNLSMWMLWNSSTSALGSWAIGADGTNHVLQQTNSGSSATYDVGGDVAWADQKFAVKARWSTTSTVIYVSVRFNSPDGYYYLQVTPGSKPKIRARISGSTTDVCAGTVNFSGVAGTWYTVTLTAQGSTISADIDGTPICSGASTAILAGGIAVGTDGGPAAFDNVTVTAP